MDIMHYLQAGLAFIVVIGLMIGLVFILKKINEVQGGIHSKQSRIKILELRMIDTKNKAALIRCDDKDHLVILGQNGTIVVNENTPVTKENTAS